MPRITVTPSGVQVRVKAFVTKYYVRVTIPKSVWRDLGEPTEFVLEVVDGKIVLVPVR